MYIQKYKSKNKYKAQTSIYNGISYHSRAEAEHAMGLDDDLKQGKIKSWKGQHKIPINILFESELPSLTDEDGLELKKRNIEFNHLCNYYIDFVVEHNDGELEYVEVKGMETELWKMKWKLCEAIFKDHPKITLTVVKVGGSWRNYKPKK